MLVSYAWEEKLFDVFSDILFVITDSHEAILDDVGHNNLVYLFNFLSI